MGRVQGYKQIRNVTNQNPPPGIFACRNFREGGMRITNRESSILTYQSCNVPNPTNLQFALFRLLRWKIILFVRASGGSAKIRMSVLQGGENTASKSPGQTGSVESLRLVVAEKNIRALACYERLGYRPCDREGRMRAGRQPPAGMPCVHR